MTNSKLTNKWSEINLEFDLGSKWLKNTGRNTLDDDLNSIIDHNFVFLDKIWRSNNGKIKSWCRSRK